MMKELAEAFVRNLKVGDILWVIRSEIANGKPHPHLIVGLDEDHIYTVCGTSTKETTESVSRFRMSVHLSFYPCFGP